MWGGGVFHSFKVGVKKEKIKLTVGVEKGARDGALGSGTSSSELSLSVESGLSLS